MLTPYMSPLKTNNPIEIYIVIEISDTDLSYYKL